MVEERVVGPPEEKIPLLFSQSGWRASRCSRPGRGRPGHPRPSLPLPSQPQECAFACLVFCWLVLLHAHSLSCEFFPTGTLPPSSSPRPPPLHGTLHLTCCHRGVCAHRSPPDVIGVIVLWSLFPARVIAPSAQAACLSSTTRPTSSPVCDPPTPPPHCTAHRTSMHRIAWPHSKPSPGRLGHNTDHPSERSENTTESTAQRRSKRGVSHIHQKRPSSLPSAALLVFHLLCPSPRLQGSRTATSPGLTSCPTLTSPR